MVGQTEVSLWIVHHNPSNKRGKTRINLDLEPCPTILGGGIFGDNTSHYWLECDDGVLMPFEVIEKLYHDTGVFKKTDFTDKPCPTINIGTGGNYQHFQVHYSIRDNPPMQAIDTSKPAYKVPSMPEIEAIDWNGYSVVSTFSGTGGSCLGYRMAGYKVLWANEFIPAAQDSYQANHPTSILDKRDIRTISPDEILEAIGLNVGELDLLDGSPPCASFSTAGKREAGWGKVKSYSDTKQRTDDLFFEYIRILKGLQPKVFVAENVSGLVKGTAKGYFKEILSAMKDCGYRVTAKLLDAQWLGVPQARQRIIFVGVRNDLGLDPVHPNPLPYRYSVRDAIPWIVSVPKVEGNFIDARQSADFPSPTVLDNGVSQSGRNTVEVESSIEGYAIGREWDNTQIGGSNSRFFKIKKSAIEEPSFSVTAEGGNTSLASVTHPTEKRKFSIAELRRICAFPDDFILTGSYAQQWERLGRSVPPVMMYHIAKAIQNGILDKCAE